MEFPRGRPSYGGSGPPQRRGRQPRFPHLRGTPGSRGRFARRDAPRFASQDLRLSWAKPLNILWPLPVKRGCPRHPAPGTSLAIWKLVIKNGCRAAPLSAHVQVDVRNMLLYEATGRENAGAVRPGTALASTSKPRATVGSAPVGPADEIRDLLGLTQDRIPSFRS